MQTLIILTVLSIVCLFIVISTLDVYSPDITLVLEPKNGQVFDYGVNIRVNASVTSSVDIYGVKVELFTGYEWETIIFEDGLSTNTWEYTRDIGTAPNGSYAVKLSVDFADPMSDKIIKENVFYVEGGVYNPFLSGFESNLILWVIFGLLLTKKKRTKRIDN